MTPEKEIDLRIAEYNALRAEIRKHIAIENLLATFNIAVFGTILGVVFQNLNASLGTFTRFSVLLILFYPILALFLFAGWYHNKNQTKQLGNYIKKYIESRVGRDKMGWEHYLADEYSELSYWAIGGVFSFTEFLAIVLGVYIVFNTAFNTTFLALITGQLVDFDWPVNVAIVIAVSSFLATSFFLLAQILRQER